MLRRPECWLWASGLLLIVVLACFLCHTRSLIGVDEHRRHAPDGGAEPCDWWPASSVIAPGASDRLKTMNPQLGAYTVAMPWYSRDGFHPVDCDCAGSRQCTGQL